MTHATESLGSLDNMLDWFDESGVGAGPIHNVVPLTGGTQNVLIKFTRGENDYVLRRPPTHKRRGSDEAMRRESRVLAALAHSRVPHPALRAQESDESRFGDACFVMDAVDGFTATEEVPEAIAESPDTQYRMGIDALDALLGILNVDPRTVGLPIKEDWVSLQVDKWERLYCSHAAHESWDPSQLDGIELVATWLRAHQPSTGHTGLVHGDFHFGNIMFDRHSAHVTAVIDWELASCGDPLLDLGHFLASYPDSGDARTTGTAVPLPGLPSRAALIERYIEQTGRTESEVTWFRVLACFRLAIIIEGTHARSLAGLAPAATGSRLHNAAQYLIEQAITLVTSDPLDKGTIA